jgi:hypothetical protein
MRLLREPHASLGLLAVPLALSAQTRLAWDSLATPRIQLI